MLGMTSLNTRVEFIEFCLHFRPLNMKLSVPYIQVNQSSIIVNFSLT